MILPLYTLLTFKYFTIKCSAINNRPYAAKRSPKRSFVHNDFLKPYYISELGTMSFFQFINVLVFKTNDQDKFHAHVH